jgi:tRNA-2-methylthio-N6-dimethylallyladenosine synthase
MTEETRPTVYIETYGCQMNVSDSELMLGKLAESGYDEVSMPEEADVILVNTCAIREHAEQRVIGRLGEMKSTPCSESRDAWRSGWVRRFSSERAT